MSLFKRIIVMSELLERRITEWATWYHKNHDRIPPGDVLKQLQFLQIVVDGFLEIAAITAKDIQRLEGRGGGAIRMPNGGLLIPRSPDYSRL